MCTQSVQVLFRRLYVGLCLALCVLGIFLVITCPPLYTEMFVVVPQPVNGSLQSIVCQENVKVTLADGTITKHCEYSVNLEEKPRPRIKIYAYHIPMGIPCILVYLLAVFFAFTTSKEAAYHGLISADLLFMVETYCMELSCSDGIGLANMGSGGGGRRSFNTLYRWECTFWVYVFAVHVVLLLMLASPVDVFDFAVTAIFHILCIMYLCRPRPSDSDDSGYEGGAGGGMYSQSSMTQSFVMCFLVLIAINTFICIPHVYEGERLWALCILLVFDSLLLITHLYDHIPTMYTIVMGRLIYVVGVQLVIVLMFFCFKHRLQKYSAEQIRMV
jgi:hypothetical protein